MTPIPERFALLPARQLVCYVGGAPELRTLLEVQPGMYLAREAALAFLAMQEAAAADGITLRINSAWRSMTQQERLYREWQAGSRKARPAEPGRSLHQSGRAVDINRSHDDPDGGGPQVGATDKWLRDNAARWGWRQPLKSEPWHWEHNS